MRWLRDKWRIVLGSVGVLALLVVVGGFAFTRGYFMHFVVRGETISREAFFELADDVAANGNTIHCTSEWTVGWLYLYETHCFDTDAEVIAYMEASS